jgi:hypothetical protein
VNHEHDDDYLWSARGEPDADLVELESQLRPLAWKSPPWRGLRQPQGRPPRRYWRRAGIALAAMLLLSIGLQAWYAHRLRWPDSQPWQIAASHGDVRIDGAALDAGAMLATGRVLETGADGQVRMQAARIGEVVIGADSRFVLHQTRSGRHRTQLLEGRLWARIWAPPGWFGVATPAGDVFDLGCEFVVDAHRDGSGALTVRSGWVQIDNFRREVLVPEGTRVEFGIGGEPGTPYDLGASPEFIAALQAIDANQDRIAPEGDEVRRLLAASRPQDAISLLVLLGSRSTFANGPMFDRMLEIMPVEARVTRAAVLQQGALALNPWWNALPYPRIKRWWLQWPDAFATNEGVDALLQSEPR